MDKIDSPTSVMVFNVATLGDSGSLGKYKDLIGNFFRSRTAYIDGIILEQPLYSQILLGCESIRKIQSTPFLMYGLKDYPKIGPKSEFLITHIFA
jgi:hypothetical protein